MSCANHGDDACCFDCLPQNIATDGVGFPHPVYAAGRTPLRRCEHCERFVPRIEWHQQKRMPYGVGCSACLPDGDPAGPYPGRMPKR